MRSGLLGRALAPLALLALIAALIGCDEDAIPPEMMALYEKAEAQGSVRVIARVAGGGAQARPMSNMRADAVTMMRSRGVQYAAPLSERLPLVVAEVTPAQLRMLYASGRFDAMMEDAIARAHARTKRSARAGARSLGARSSRCRPGRGGARHRRGCGSSLFDGSRCRRGLLFLHFGRYGCANGVPEWRGQSDRRRRRASVQRRRLRARHACRRDRSRAERHLLGRRARSRDHRDLGFQPLRGPR